MTRTGVNHKILQRRKGKDEFVLKSFGKNLSPFYFSLYVPSILYRSGGDVFYDPLTFEDVKH